MNNADSVQITNFALEPVIATAIRISVVEMVLKSHVTLQICFLNADGNQVKNETIKIEGSDYAAWGTNDDYLTELVMENFGLAARSV